MFEFVLNAIVWTLALYGLIEIVKTVLYLYTYTNMKSDGIYIVVAVKNQEEKIEGFMRSVLFRLIYGKEQEIKNVIITDLDSTDESKAILQKIEEDYDYVKVNNWRECKELFDNINNN